MDNFQLAYITEDDSTFVCKALKNTDEFNLKVNSKDENKEQLALQIKNSAPSTSKADNSNLQTIQSNFKHPRGKKSNDNNHVKNEEFEKQVSHSPKNSCFLQSRGGGGEKSSQKRKINVDTCNNQQKVNNKKRIKKAKISYYYKCTFCNKEVDDLKAHTDSKHQSQFFKNDDDANKDVDNAAKKYPKKKQAKEELLFSSVEDTYELIPVRSGPKNDEDANNDDDNAAKEYPKKCVFCNIEVDDLKAHEDFTHPQVRLEHGVSMFSSDDEDTDEPISVMLGSKNDEDEHQDEKLTKEDSPPATYQKYYNSSDEDSDGWSGYIEKIKNKKEPNIYKGLDKVENENNKNEEMQFTSSESLEKNNQVNNQSKSFEDTNNVVEFTEEELDFIIGLSSHDVDKRFNPLSPPKEAKIINHAQVNAIKWQEDAMTIPINRIIIHEVSSPNQQYPKCGIVEYLCPLGRETPFICSNRIFDNPEKVKRHLVCFHEIENRLKMESFPPIERITYKY